MINFVSSPQVELLSLALDLFRWVLVVCCSTMNSIFANVCVANVCVGMSLWSVIFLIDRNILVLLWYEAHKGWILRAPANFWKISSLIARTIFRNEGPVLFSCVCFLMTFQGIFNLATGFRFLVYSWWMHGSGSFLVCLFMWIRSSWVLNGVENVLVCCGGGDPSILVGYFWCCFHWQVRGPFAHKQTQMSRIFPLCNIYALEWGVYASWREDSENGDIWQSGYSEMLSTWHTCARAIL